MSGMCVRVYCLLQRISHNVVCVEGGCQQGNSNNAVHVLCVLCVCVYVCLHMYVHNCVYAAAY